MAVAFPVMFLIFKERKSATHLRQSTHYR